MVPRIDRLAMRPVGHAARSGIDGMLAGRLPETVARSLVEHRVVSRIAAEMLEAAGEQGRDAEELEWLVERVLTSTALTSWVESGDAGRLMEPFVASVLQSDALRQTMVDVAGSPELRSPLTRLADRTDGPQRLERGHQFLLL